MVLYHKRLWGTTGIKTCKSAKVGSTSIEKSWNFPGGNTIATTSAR
jgi:hypothetical protein